MDEHVWRSALLLLLLDSMAWSQAALSPARVSDKWGYANAGTGEMVIPPQYERAGRFAFDRAPVRLDGKYGYIDSAGRLAIPCRFQMARPFSERLAAISLGGRFGFIDLSGETVIPPAYDWAGDFRDDRALVRIDQRYGYIDQKGARKIEPRYVRAMPFSEGRAAVAEEEGHYYYVDVNGNRLTDATYAKAGEFQEGLAWFQSRDGLYGYQNTEGKFVTPPQFRGAGNFSHGVAPAHTGSGWCFVDKTGQQVTSPEFDDASIEAGRIRVRQGDRSGTGTVRNGQIRVSIAAHADPWMAKVAFESDPKQAAIYKPPLLEYEREPPDDPSRLLIPQYRVSGGDTNCTDLLDSRDEYMILFVIPGKAPAPRRCVPGVDARVYAQFPP